MIVPPAKARMLLNGKATQHRRLMPLAAKVGQDIPIRPAPNRPMVGRARIVSIQDERLGDITYHQARAEGHRTTNDFKADWVAKNDQRWIAGRDLDEDALLKRFNRRWADTRVYAITLQPVADQPLYLASQYDILHGHTNTGEYTTQRGKAIDDLEVCDPAVVDRYAQRAAPFGEAQRAQARQGLNAAARGGLSDAYQAKRNQRLAMFKRPAREIQ